MFAFPDYLRAPSSVQLLLTMGEQLQRQRTRLLAGTGLTLNRLKDVNAVVTPDEELGVISNLLQQVDNPAGLGLVIGLQHQLTAYGILGYGLMSSATGLDAMTMIQRFMPLTYTFVQIQFSQQAGVCHISFKEPDGLPAAIQRFVLERAMAATTRVMQDMSAGAFTLDSFDISYAAPIQPVLTIPEHMINVPINFNATSNALSFQAAQLLQPLPHANPATAAMCERLCSELMQQRHSRLSTAMIVRDCLNSAASGYMPGMGDIARQLHVSERTLKRRLQAEGTSFRDLQAESLCKRAEQLLAGESSLTHIAEVLGFADLSTFSQAYKRWTGMPPSLYRNSGNTSSQG